MIAQVVLVRLEALDRRDPHTGLQCHDSIEQTEPHRAGLG
jgi:hypothetical protein